MEGLADDIIRKLRSNCLYDGRIQDINMLISKTDDVSLIKKVYNVYVQSRRPYYVVGSDSSMLRILEEIINSCKVPVLFHNLIILKAVDSNISDESLTKAIKSVILNKFTFIRFEDRIELKMDEETEDLANEAIKSLIVFK
jgi:hypothetical protein